MSATIGLEQAILGHTLAFAQMLFPTRVYVALCAAAIPPTETTPGVEAFGGGYARAPATFALISTPANTAANTTTVQFPYATADWGTLGFFELWDAPTGGNRLYWGPLAPVLTIVANGIARFSAGTLSVQAASGTGTTSAGAYLPLAGGALTGPLLLSRDPVGLTEAATKGYVDVHSGTGGGAGFLPISGGTLTGALTLVGNAAASLQPVTLQQMNSALALNVVTSFNTRPGAVTLGAADITAAGGALLASPTLSGTPTAPTAPPSTNNTQIATTQYVDRIAGGPYLALSGGTVVGATTFSAAGTSLTVSNGLTAGAITFSTLPVNAINDSTAAAAGVPVGGIYRNATSLFVRQV